LIIGKTILIFLKPLAKQCILYFIICFAGICLFSLNLYAKENEKAVYVDYPYAINLQSTREPLDKKSLPNLTIFKNLRLYTTSVKLNGQTWTRLRLGFFKTKQNALDAHKKLVKYFPEAWVTIVSEQERNDSIKTAIALSGRVLPSRESAQETDISSSEGERSDLSTLSPLPPLAAKSTPSFISSTAAVAVTATDTTTTPVDDLASANTGSKAAAAVAISSANNTGIEEKATKISSTKTGKLLEQARTAFTAGEYQKTIQLTTAILEMPASSESKDALELLGVARERNGQIAHAKAEYEKYLELYPEGEDAKRVSQRLAGLVTAASKPTSLANSGNKTKTKRPVSWQSVGSFSQYYYRDERSIDEEDNLVDLSQIVTTFDMRSRKRTENYDQNFQITAYHAYDFLDDESDGRFSRLYYELINRNNNNHLKVGRQTYSEGGVLGLFDGGVFGLGVTRKSSVNLAAGYLLDIEDLLDFSYTKDRKFASLSYDVGNEIKDWDISLYYIQQMVNNLVDRQAVGSEIRYFKPTFNIFNLIDYDTSYDTLNIFLLNANWVFPQQGNLYATIDSRKVPYLSTSNALQGQPFETIEDLETMFTEEEIRQLALDRTATSNTFTIGGAKQLNGFMNGHGQYQISGDLTYNTLSDMPASGGVPEIPDTGDNYFVGAQFIGSNVIKKGDTSIFSLRLGFTQLSNDLTLNFDTRYPITDKFRFNPRIQYFRREGKDNDNLLTTLRLSAKADYRLLNNKMLIEGEIGYDNTDDQVAGFSTKSNSLFWYLGYRLDF
jgi:tetratricopeptide (TPR) repeat protein